MSIFVEQMFAKAKSCIRAGLPKQGLGPKAKEGNPPPKNNELVILRKQKKGELCVLPYVPFAARGFSPLLPCSQFYL